MADDKLIKIPDTWDNTIAGTHQTCPRKFEYRVLRGLVPRVQARSLSFGAAVHEGLAAWYRTSKDDLNTIGKKLTIAIKHLDPEFQLYSPGEIDQEHPSALQLREELAVLVALKALPPIEDVHAGDHRTHALCEEIIRNYCHIYKHEPFEVIHVEKSFAVFLDDNTLWSGLLDLVIRWVMEDKIIIMDHKTTSQIFNFGENFTPGQQMSGYMMGLKYSMSEPVHNEVCINAIQVSKRKAGLRPEDFQRFPNISRTDSQLDEFVVNALEEVYDARKNIERGFFPMRTESCHHYGGCPFRPVCRVAPENREMMISNFYNVHHWDPLERKDGLEKYSIGVEDGPDAVFKDPRKKNSSPE